MNGYRLRSLIGLAFTSLMAGVGCQGCSGDPPAKGPCGQGAIEVAYGYGRPLEPLSDGALLIEYGLQGGYHVDVSLRFTGDLNPDLVDVNIDLSVTSGDNPEGIYGVHNTELWYLLFPQADEAEGCYFYSARVFLFDEREEIPTESMVAALDGGTAHLELTLTHMSGTTLDAMSFPLRFIPPSP